MSDFQKILAELKEIKAALVPNHKRSRLFTIPETAVALGLKEKTVRNRVSDGSFPIKPVHLAGRTMFRVADIDDLVARLGADNG